MIKATFAARAAHYHGELNAIHPFREGNGRAVRVWLVHLARQAGHDLVLRRMNSETWLQASRESMKAISARWPICCTWRWGGQPLGRHDSRGRSMCP
ncbi:MAG: hypothetical protein HC861_07920 [Rhodospirillaceae bacterium]|nr:hypothetical protein [Rhodospirillaceae bacterium]